MINMTFTELAAILGAKAPEKEGAFSGLSKDTRNISPNNLYVAIIGEQLDGHDYIDEAFKKGAAAALVSRKVACPIPQILVSDTIIALGKLAENWRDRFSAPLVGVTGSNGKTTLKNMIASILCAAAGGDQSKVLSTEGNLNNAIGMPLMLGRMNANQRYGVIEMGMNSFGEIEYLSKLTKPAVAVITNAAESHLQGVKDIAGVARAKGEIFSGLQPNGVAVLNKDDTHFEYWRGLVSNHKYLTFGLQNSADVTAVTTSEQNLTQQHINIRTPMGEIEVTLPLLGQHNIMNALAATAVGLALHLELSVIKEGLEHVQAAPGRMNHHMLEDGVRIIDDSYNANPFSTNAAINALALFEGKKILVLGDMRELGDDAEHMHAVTGEKARAAGINNLFTLGELTAATSKSFGAGAQHFTDREKLLDALKPHLEKGCTVLIKGSRSMKMEKILAGLIPEDALPHLH